MLGAFNKVVEVPTVTRIVENTAGLLLKLLDEPNVNICDGDEAAIRYRGRMTSRDIRGRRRRRRRYLCDMPELLLGEGGRTALRTSTGSVTLAAPRPT